MRSIFLIIIFIISLTACNDRVMYTPEEIEAKGHLVIVGGGTRTPEIMQRIVDLGGGPGAKVLVVPFASGIADSVGTYQRDEFIALGCSAQYILCNREDIDKPENLAMLDEVSIVFFSGGDQNRLKAHIGGTKFFDRIESIYNNGGVISGTSAGAAVMSKIMITGQQEGKTEEEVDFNMIKRGDVLTAEGFGFLENIIIDQHFIYRKRQNRLLSLLKDHPDKRGVGIDESTAIVVYPDSSFEVIGESQVMVYEPAGVNGSGELNRFNLILLSRSDRYSLK